MNTNQINSREIISFNPNIFKKNSNEIEQNITTKILNRTILSFNHSKDISSIYNQIYNTNKTEKLNIIYFVSITSIKVQKNRTIDYINVFLFSSIDKDNSSKNYIIKYQDPTEKEKRELVIDHDNKLFSIQKLSNDKLIILHLLEPSTLNPESLKSSEKTANNNLYS